ncbi:MAG: hypothetical protein GKS03_01340 [Alphaproteobacteria bacterium]|nr:hypothetical protein [Alphaproteobacteria bacterium]
MIKVVVSTLVICVLLWNGVSTAQNGDSDKTNPNITRWSEGTIVYRTIEAQRVRANESWRLTTHPDGSRTMRSYVDNLDAETNLNMIHRVAANFRPLESLVTYWTRGEYRGAGMFTVNGSTLNATVSGPSGSAVETVEVPDKFSIVPHPLATDSWHTWYFDKTKGGIQKVTMYNLQVTAPNSGIPVLGKIQYSTMSFEGVEDVTVPAGTFTTDHYKIGKGINVWVSGPDNMMVRYAMPDRDLEYVLTSFTTGGHQ